MEQNNYSEYSLKELYALYTEMHKQNNPEEAQVIFQQIVIKEKTEKLSAPEDILASRMDRLAASLIDSIIIGLPVIILWIILMVYSGVDSISSFAQQFLESRFTYSLLFLVSGQVLYAAVNSRLLIKSGQTIGKKFLDIRIVDEKGNIPEFTKSYGMRTLLPAVIGVIPYFGGYFSFIDTLFIFSRSRRCLHDHIAGTKVVKNIIQE